MWYMWGGGHLGTPGAHTVLRGSALLGISDSQTASIGCSGKAVAGFSIVDSSKRSPDGIMKRRMDTSDILFFFLCVIIFKICKTR